MDVICYERKKLYALDALRKLAREKNVRVQCVWHCHKLCNYDVTMLAMYF